MFREPFIAHPAKCARIHTTWHPQSKNDDNRAQHEDCADDQQHIVLDLAVPRATAQTVSIERAPRCSGSHSARLAWRLFFSPLGCAQRGTAVLPSVCLCTREQRGSAPLRTLATCNSNPSRPPLLRSRSRRSGGIPTNQTAVIPVVEPEIRWRDWQARGAANDRRTATRMRILLLFIVAALAVWFVVQLA
jgi:hypothetical protein